MSGSQSPEEWVQSLAVVRTKVAGGPYFVELRGLAEPPVFIGPYQNPAIAKEDGDKIRKFLAALIREARQATAGVTSEEGGDTAAAAIPASDTQAACPP